MHAVKVLSDMVGKIVDIDQVSNIVRSSSNKAIEDVVDILNELVEVASSFYYRRKFLIRF